jgi:hypothetical protein
VPQPRRHLIASADAQKSVVYGSGLGPSIVAMTSYTVNVQARDSSDNILSFGGDTFKIKIHNKCTIGVSQSWTADTSAKAVFASPIDATMTDNGNGTYSYTYTPQQSGEITVLVYLEDSLGVYFEHFDNHNWSGDPASTITYNNIDINWGSGDIITGRSDFVSSYIYTKLRAPASTTYTFNLDSDDGSDLLLDGVVKVSKAGTGCICADTFTETLTAGQLYLIKIKHLENSGGALIKLSWSYSGNPMTTIPGKNSRIWK